MYYLLSVVVCLLCLVETVDAEACKTMCYNDRSPRCKVVIEKDTMKEIRGIYKILNGIINMTCAINSLPTPVNILWKYRPKTENKFISVPCGNEQKTESCNVNENGEHHTVGHCSVPTNHLHLSGFYRCEALQSNGILVASNESEIEIIGIEYTNKVQDKLVVGEDGYIDVKICANPQPELFWVLPQGQIIQPGHGQLRFSASNIWHDQNKPVELDGPSERQPYCYRNKLIIGSVAKEDKEIFLIVRNEGETREVNLNLNVKSSSFSTQPSFFICNLTLLLILCIFMK